jgi:hypothetical protein
VDKGTSEPYRKLYPQNEIRNKALLSGRETAGTPFILVLPGPVQEKRDQCLGGHPGIAAHERDDVVRMKECLSKIVIHLATGPVRPRSPLAKGQVKEVLGVVLSKGRLVGARGQTTAAELKNHLPHLVWQDNRPVALSANSNGSPDVDLMD